MAVTRSNKSVLKDNMIDEKYVQDYVKNEINKHEADFTKYGWKALCLFILNEALLLWLIWNK